MKCFTFLSKKTKDGFWDLSWWPLCHDLLNRGSCSVVLEMQSGLMRPDHKWWMIVRELCFSCVFGVKVLEQTEGLVVLHSSGPMNNLNKKEKWQEESVNKYNGCEAWLKMRNEMRNDRGEFYSRQTEVRHQRTRVGGGERDTARARERRERK